MGSNANALVMVEQGRLAQRFVECFGSRPRIFSAPGRVNIIGEHTDYNEGFVLPMAINRRTYVAAHKREDRRVRAKSLLLNDEAEFDLDKRSTPAKKWVRYIAGVVWSLLDQGITITGADLLIDSDVPMGGGLSSSAALEVASGKAFAALADTEIDGIKLALAAQRAETVFVGAQVGIMDQLAAVFGRRGHALLIDCRSLETKAVPLANLKAAIVVCNTNVKHDLASSAYNQRRAECEQGVELLRQRLPRIQSLRDITVEDFQKHESDLPATVRRRCRHVITENDRTLKAFRALRDGNTELLGKLMNASHESLRNDYEVTSPELDTMVQIAWQNEYVFGARMTGAGFGGCTINVLRSESVDDFCEFVSQEYQAATNTCPDIYVVNADDGAREEVLSVPGAVATG